MIKSVGIYLAVSGEHKVRCLDERAEACDGFSFQTTSEGLAKLEERIFGDGSNPIIIFEPTGITWLVMAIYLKARHPDCRLVRVQGRKVVALRKYLHRSSKSDKIDALTLAKMSFIDSDRLEEVYLPPEKIYTMHRLTRQRKRLESEITTQKTQIGSIIDGYLPSLRKAFSDHSAFANYSGVVPAARQSSQAEAKGLRMTKPGPATLKWALYQASQISRRYDSQLASIYYREMVHHGKNHKQSMGAVMSHLGARVLSVLRKNEPNELRDTQGNPITSEEARRLILSDFQVPEEIRRERRRHKTTVIAPKLRRKRREIVTNRAHEAAGAPQPVIAISPGN